MNKKLKLTRCSIRENWSLFLCGFFIMMTWLDNLPKLDELTQYNEFQLILNYSIGFIPRGFIGTLLLPIKYFTAKHFAIIFAVITLFFVVVYVSFCVWLLRGSLERKVSEYWILLMTFLPMTVANVFDVAHYGNTDILMISILLINAWLLTTRKRGGIIISTILVTIGMLIHSVYSFLFFAGTFNLLLWLSWKTKKKSYIVAAALDTVIVISLLFYFNSGRPLLFMPFENIEAYILGRTSENMDYAITFIPLWFSSSLDVIRDSYKQSLFYFTLDEAAILYLLLLPVITWIFVFWRRCYKRFGSPKVFWIFALSLISVLPCHRYMTDHGRWMAGPFWSQLVLLFSVLNYKDSDGEREIFTELFSEKTETYRFGLLLYLLILGPVGIITVNKPVHRIWLAVRTVFSKVIGAF